jgi:competence protein ComEC
VSAAAQPRPLRIGWAMAGSPAEVPTTPAPVRALLAPRQPLLYAVLCFSAGVLLGTHVWRPPMWWALALLVFFAAGAILLGRRPRWAVALASGALVLLGAFAIQARGPVTVNNEILRFADGGEVRLTAHVITDGLRREGGFGTERQVVEVETEQVGTEFSGENLQAGIRLTIYSRPESGGEGKPIAPRPLYTYGQRLRLTAKLRPPRNFGNPGAFDYRGYLAQRSIAALGFANQADVQMLPGFVGNRSADWRNRLRRSVLAQIHALWPAQQAALMDAMVIGEDAFIDRDTRVNFQRSGAYHVLVVSGMNWGFSRLWCSGSCAGFALGISGQAWPPPCWALAMHTYATGDHPSCVPRSCCFSTW